MRLALCTKTCTTPWTALAHRWLLAVTWNWPWISILTASSVHHRRRQGRVLAWAPGTLGARGAPPGAAAAADTGGAEATAEGWFPNTFVVWSVLDDDATTIAGQDWGRSYGAAGGGSDGASGSSAASGGRVRSLMAYEASEASELSFSLGEELSVVEHDDGSGWLSCENAEGAQGWVAAAYVEWIDSATGGDAVGGGSGTIQEEGGS